MICAGRNVASDSAYQFLLHPAAINLRKSPIVWQIHALAIQAAPTLFHLWSVRLDQTECMVRLHSSLVKRTMLFIGPASCSYSGFDEGPNARNTTRRRLTGSKGLLLTTVSLRNCRTHPRG